MARNDIQEGLTGNLTAKYKKHLTRIIKAQDSII